MISIMSVKKLNNNIFEENMRLCEDIKKHREGTNHWKMLSQLFLEEINKAHIRYQCDSNIESDKTITK